MSRPLRLVAAWGLFVLSWALLLGGAVFSYLTRSTHVPGNFGTNDLLYAFLSLLPFAAFPVVGLLIALRRPENRVGWVVLLAGVSWLCLSFGSPYAIYGLATRPGAVPAPAALGALTAGWVPGMALIGLLGLWFPNGRLVSARWRVAQWVAIGCGAVGAAAGVLTPGPAAGVPGTTNPFGLAGVGGSVASDLQAVIFGVVLSLPAAAASLVVRYRRANTEERAQIRWVAFAGGIVALAFIASLVAAGLTGALSATTGPQAGAPFVVGVLQDLALASLCAVPAAVGIAILKYRLYEIDVVINRTLVYGSLAAFITAVYVAIVVGIGAGIGRQRSHPSLVLSILATAVVAVAFGPVKERIQRLANRLVYGKRATPYEVLSAFAERMARSYALDELLPNVAAMLAQGTGARAAEVWLRVGPELRLEGWWPLAGTPAANVLPAGASPELDDRSRLAPVRHQGEELGCLVIRKGAGDQISPGDEHLLSDVAGQAGLVLRNVRLIEDLRASRQRLVAARDSERRKLERNIHDGAQQRLVALAVRFNLARGLAGDDEIAAALARLGEQTQGALENLRDLARGIYPPVLADQGLVAALEGQARRSALPVQVVATGVGRYPQEVEAAVYFCCLEALQNVAKYAGATRAVVRLEESAGALTFEVEDDGAGFDPVRARRGAGLTNMEDRLAVLDASLTVRSRPGAGTTVTGRVPVGVAAAAMAV